MPDQINVPESIASWTYYRARNFLIVNCAWLRLCLEKIREVASFKGKWAKTIDFETVVATDTDPDWSRKTKQLANFLSIDQDFLEKLLVDPNFLKKTLDGAEIPYSLPIYIATVGNPITEGFYIRVDRRTDRPTVDLAWKVIKSMYKDEEKYHPDHRPPIVYRKSSMPRLHSKIEVFITIERKVWNLIQIQERQSKSPKCPMGFSLRQVVGDVIDDVLGDDAGDDKNKAKRDKLYNQYESIYHKVIKFYSVPSLKEFKNFYETLR